MTEYVQGVEVVRQFNYEPRAHQRMHAVNLGKYKVDVTTQFREYAFWGVFMLGETAAAVMVLLVAAPLVIEHKMTLGTLVALFEYLRGHPDLYVPPGKEVPFFSHDSIWSAG